MKAGDTIRRINKAFSKAQVGQLATVTRVFGNSVGVTYPGCKEFESWEIVNCDLVKTPAQKTVLPHDSAERKTYPLLSGLFDYFESALCEVAHHSHMGNEKHNPGQTLHWARAKSDDHLDAAMRHIVERDLRGASWRILAALQMELEGQGYPKAPGAR
jgi:hypothetical protein